MRRLKLSGILRKDTPKELKKLEKAEVRARELYEYDEEVTLKQYEEQVGKIRAKRNAVRQEKEELERKIERTIDLEEIEKEIRFLHAEMISGLELLTFEEKRKIVDLLVDRVVVAGDKVRIEGVLPPPGDPQSDLPEKSVIASKSSPY